MNLNFGKCALGAEVDRILHTFLDESPSTGEVSLTGDEPWNNKQEGFIWARGTQTDLSGSGQEYLVDLNDGDSNPSAGVRLEKSDDDQEERYRDDAGNVVSGSLAGPNIVIENTIRTYGLSWNNNLGLVTLVGGGAIKQYTFTPKDAVFADDGFTKKRVGERNGGSNPFTGTITEYEIGNLYHSSAALGKRMQHSNSLILLGGGQSLMSGHWDSQESSGNAGYVAFVTDGAALYSKEIIPIDGAEGGSGLSIRTDADEYWWDDVTTNEPGEVYHAFVTAAGQVGATPDWCFWSQGEADSHVIDTGGEITAAEYKALLLLLFQRMRTDLNPDLKIGIQGIGRRTTFSNTGGIQTIREIQQELADENSWIYILGYSHDADLYTDNIHLSDAGYTLVAPRLIRRAADIDGETVTGSTVGPTMTGASRSSTTVTVTIAHDAGTDITPTAPTDIVGFRFFDDGVEISITDAVRTNATTVTLELGSTPSGVEELYYCYDDATDITDANISEVLKDNSAQAMPLVPAKVTVT